MTTFQDLLDTMAEYAEANGLDHAEVLVELGEHHMAGFEEKVTEGLLDQAFDVMN